MKPSNFLHMFALMLMIGFTFSEHSNLKINYDEQMYNLRVQKSHLSRYAIKNPSAKEQVIAVANEMEELTETYKFKNNLTSYKAIFISVLFLIFLWQFIRYFKIDFDDDADVVINSNYLRKTWLLNFFLFFILAAWSYLIRGSAAYGSLFYLVAIASLVRSLMIATDLRLITKERGTPAFNAVTITTSVILYFNFIMLAGLYFNYSISKTVITWNDILEMIK